MKRLRIRLVCDILKASSQRPSSLSRSVVIPSNSRNLSSSTNDIQSFPFGCRGRTVTPSSLMEKCNVIFVLGAPGSGKSTLCSQLAAYLDYQHLSAGELIRQEAGNPLSPHGKTVAEAIRVPGAFVPAEITVDLLQRAMQSSSRKEFLIDAFPVNMANLQAWNAKMASAAEIPCVLFLEVPMRLATERCLGRKRGDDTALGLEMRWKSYMDQTRPMVEFYKEKGLLRTVDGSQSPEQVLEATKRMLPVKGKDTEPDRSKWGG